jgi:crotonobetainyl-CoA:carnitine CoA-transferase CaiB-like acyl-CoA transferase
VATRQESEHPMRLGDVGNEDAAPFGKPLDGLRVLALEQMQALPFCTQLLARLGADVVKVEHPVEGEMARPSYPFIRDPEGRQLGATFLRNNLNKRSICIDLKSDRGRGLILELAPKFDIVAENFKSGTLARMGLGYHHIEAVHSKVVYLSISGFGNLVHSPYDTWPAFASVAEAMSGMYDFKQVGDNPPTVSPFGALGDTTSGLFATIGVLAALRQRDRTGVGQHIDIAMYDALISMADIVPEYWSLGMRDNAALPLIMDGFRASDGWFVIQAGRPFQFHRLADLIGQPDWKTDERLQTPPQWREHLETILRPGIEAWAATRKKLEICHLLANAGVAAGPCNSAEDVISDVHVQQRNMIVEIPRPDGVDQPVLVPGNPVKMSKMADGPDVRMPWLGEHTADVLAEELGLNEFALARLREDGVIG